MNTIALIIDTLIGDPGGSMHPVVIMGKLISSLEKVLYREDDPDDVKYVKGGFLMLAVLAAVYGAAKLAENVIWRISAELFAPFSLDVPFFGAIDGGAALSSLLTAFLLSFMISPRSLAAAGEEIRDLLLSENLVDARKKVGWIVGRDTDNLSVSEATRATVETIAENIVDGIISPLFWFALGGIPLAAAYRAANTMDSMIGYKNDKYLFFGRVAARTDDVWNYIPARLTGVMIVFASALLGLDWRAAWRTMCRDASKHPSPNGGYTEATVAGALGVRLGGLNHYFGRPSFREYMGDPISDLAPAHITLTIRLMYAVTVIFVIAADAFGLSR